PLNQRHDLGALAIAVITREAGWHGTYFGSNLPADEIAAAALRTNARAVALSITFAVNQRQLVTEMKKLRCHLSRGTDIFVGGQGAAQIMDQLSGCNIVLLTDLQKLSIELDRLLSRRDNQIFAK
ncbi:MAG: cobalamin-dependent protein, partial [Desulfobacterales bacterium]